MWIQLAYPMRARYTIDDVHYVGDQDILLSATDTPFAKDKTFGYKLLNLREWVYEKARSRSSGKKHYECHL
ncbi:hypothetical protein N7507_010183 [Penicillium longicatenatum]|nr:hypothetical protein N7507_010183 [Penicillium longicatenatum]